MFDSFPTIPSIENYSRGREWSHHVTELDRKKTSKSSLKALDKQEKLEILEAFWEREKISFPIF